MIIAPEDHPLAGREEVSAEELSNWSAVAPDFGSSGRPLSRAIVFGSRVQLNLTGSTAGWDEIKRSVESGLGIAAFPSFGVTDRDRVAVIPIRRSGPKPSYGLYTRPGESISLAAERLVQIIDSHSTAPLEASQG